MDGDRRWGSVARRGARELRQPNEENRRRDDAPRAAVRRAGQGPADDEAAGAAEPWQPDEVWVQDEADASTDTDGFPVAQARRPARATGALPRTSQAAPDAQPGRRRSVPASVVNELSAVAGPRGAKLAARLAEASHAYDHDRYQDAQRILRPLVAEAADAPAVRELNGLALYRMGRWAAAAKELEVGRALSGSYDQHPVLADCYRALRRYPPAEKLWAELREASPSAEIVAEGRIVAAGCLADQGDLAGAIAVLERAGRRVRNPQQHHIRQWYALADLHERAGDLPRARDLFGRIVAADTDTDPYDAGRRLRSLR